MSDIEFDYIAPAPKPGCKMRCYVKAKSPIEKPKDYVGDHGFKAAVYFMENGAKGLNALIDGEYFMNTSDLRALALWLNQAADWIED